MRIGVCYYPEHWPQSRWEEDARLMREAGISLVRLGEFAWSRIEPEENKFEFGWLDKAIEILTKQGLQIVLGTPTATPPIWLVERYPDILQVSATGQKRGFGSRRHYCYNSQAYREKTKEVVSRLAERYGKLETLTAWQVDNEYGCHDTVLCYCGECVKAFQEWLRARYGTIKALNEAWMNVFWSQEYSSFSQIEFPDRAVTESNPALKVDFQRFSSESVANYNHLQVTAIRTYSPKPILHNFMAFFDGFDHYPVASDLDGVTWDSYPLGMLEVSPSPEGLKNAFARTGHPDLVGFNHDLYYGLKEKPFWVMEQQPGQVNWAPSNPLPAPGAVRLWMWHAFAHGADVVSIFRWRAATGGQELMHAGMLRHDGKPDWAYPQVKQVAREIEGFIGEVGDLGQPQPRVALLHDYESLWATDYQKHAEGWRYWALMLDFYRILRGLGIDIAVVSARADLARFQMVIAPSLHLVDDEIAKRLREFASGGGRLVLGPRSGFKYPAGRVHTPAPGPLKDLVGARVVAQDALRPGLVGEIAYQGKSYQYHTWADLLETVDARVVATYEGPVYGGTPAIVSRQEGRGEVSYVGAWGGYELLSRVLGDMVRALGLKTTSLPEGVRTARRGQAVFVFNFTSHRVPLPATNVQRFLIGGAELGPWDFAVYVEE